MIIKTCHDFKFKQQKTHASDENLKIYFSQPSKPNYVSRKNESM